MILIKLLIFLVMAGFSLNSSSSNYPVSYAACTGGISPEAYCQAMVTAVYPQAGQLHALLRTAPNQPPSYYCHAPNGSNYSGPGCSLAYIDQCTGANTWDTNKILCTVPCGLSGTAKSLSVSRPSGQIVFYSGVGPTVSDAGCGYTCTAAGAVNTINSVTGVTTSTYSCVSNGNDAPGNALVATSAPPETNSKAPPGCAIGKGSDGQMITSCVKPDGCGTFNGKEVCMDGINIKTADGTVLNSGSGKNCVQGQGKIVCSTDVGNATQSITMTKPDGTTQTVYLNDKLKKAETQSVVTNPNGSTTITNTTTNNLVGDNPVVTTTTQNPDGSKTSSQTGVTQQDRDSSNLSAVAENTFKTSQNTFNTAENTKNFLAEFKAFMGVEGDFAPGSYGSDFSSLISAQNDGIIAAVNASSNSFTELAYTTPTEWVSSMLPLSNNCVGSINQTIFGKAFVFAPCEKLQPLRDVLAWVFALLAVFDILKITFRGNF